MSVQFPCPSCGKNLKAKEEMSGKMAKCPYCQTHVQVPEPTAFAEEPVVMAEEVPADTYGMEAAPQAPPREDRRPCPMCGEMIKADAIKCRFCGEVFDDSLKRAEKRRTGASAEDTNMSAAEIVLCILCSTIGCIVGVVYAVQGKPKGAKMVGLSVGVGLIIGIIQALITAAKK